MFITILLVVGGIGELRPVDILMIYLKVIVNVLHRGLIYFFLCQIDLFFLGVTTTTPALQTLSFDATSTKNFQPPGVVRLESSQDGIPLGANTSSPNFRSNFGSSTGKSTRKS